MAAEAKFVADGGIEELQRRVQDGQLLSEREMERLRESLRDAVTEQLEGLFPDALPSPPPRDETASRPPSVRSVRLNVPSGAPERTLRLKSPERRGGRGGRGGRGTSRPRLSSGRGRGGGRGGGGSQRPPPQLDARLDPAAPRLAAQPPRNPPPRNRPSRPHSSGERLGGGGGAGAGGGGGAGGEEEEAAFDEELWLSPRTQLTARTPVHALKQFAVSQGFNLHQLGEVSTPAEQRAKLRELLLLRGWPQGREAYLAALEGPRAQKPALVTHPPATAPPAPTAALAPAPPAAMRAAAAPGTMRAAAPRPAAAASAATEQSRVDLRLAALEQCLLGDDAPAQGEAPFQRLAWLEAQVGGSSGTLLRRIGALEHAAKAQGLL